MKNPLVHIALLTMLVSSMVDFKMEIDSTIPIGEANAVMDVMAAWGEQSLKVVTYNIHHGRGLDDQVDIRRIAEELREEGADIIGLQEVDRYNIRSGFKDQIEALGAELGMAWAYAPALKFGIIQYGNAVLSKYPIEAADQYELPGKRENRTLLRVQIRYGDELLDVWNTHLGVSEADRRKQMPLLLQILKTVEPKERTMPTILLGDFNMLGDHPLMEELLRDWEKVQPQGLAATVLSGLEIDHILLKGHFWTRDAFTLPTYSSDHNPVVAELIIPKRVVTASHPVSK
ncbi:endonuclease/exonuclease/phosphatase family protein [Marinicrinis lubricantis]|uniref:Endonuclease/exonuclease/phosphatase family protein n=1 Tax=Marinicrinis lubricantis TaxID=2086470 RepID=A0ABW1IRA9_9BACL